MHAKKEIHPQIFIKVTNEWPSNRTIVVTVIQNSPKTAISKHSKRQKFVDKHSQKHKV